MDEALVPEVKRIMQQYNVQTNQIWFEIGQAFRGRYCYLGSGSFHLKVRAVSAHDKTADGTYPQNAWEELSGRWYYFDESGYMKTGWIDWEGRSYYCTESGEMLKDAETPDGQPGGCPAAGRYRGERF